MLDFTGWMSREVSMVSPSESVTRRWRRYQTLSLASPLVGIVNVPLAAPVAGETNGGKCVSWWKSTHQVIADPPSVPSSVSEAAAANVNVCPPTYVLPAVGLVMVAVGALPPTTSSLTVSLGVEPYGFVTMQRKVALSSPSVVAKE